MTPIETEDRARGPGQAPRARARAGPAARRRAPGGHAAPGRGSPGGRAPEGERRRPSCSRRSERLRQEACRDLEHGLAAVRDETGRGDRGRCARRPSGTGNAPWPGFCPGSRGETRRDRQDVQGPGAGAQTAAAARPSSASTPKACSSSAPSPTSRGVGRREGSRASEEDPPRRRRAGQRAVARGDLSPAPRAAAGPAGSQGGRPRERRAPRRDLRRVLSAARGRRVGDPGPERASAWRCRRSGTSSPATNGS